MKRRKLSREFKIEAIKLVSERWCRPDTTWMSTRTSCASQSRSSGPIQRRPFTAMAR